MLRILRALRDAKAKTRDTAERGRIEGAVLEVGKRAERLSAALDHVAAMRERQKSDEARISGLSDRIQKLVGRNYRGTERWLRWWRNL